MKRAPLAALASVVAALAVPTGADAATVYETYSVPTVGGARINVEVQRDNAKTDQPVLLTYSPYNTLSEPEPAADAYASRYVPRGYARAVADVVGTRGSTGCWDYGGPIEQQSGVDLVKFLAAQPWSNGRVGMIGGSYDGTTATMVAARGKDVPELKAIVPIAAISRWYGYAYQDGVRFLGNSESASDEGFDTPLAFDFGFGRTVSPAVADDPEQATDRADLCDSVEHTQKAYNRSPEYDKFWLERDYRKDAKDFRAATLIAHGWQDYNVKQEEATALWEALPQNVFKRMWLTQGRHGSPSGARWQKLLDDFLGRFLEGRDTDVEKTAAVVTLGRTATDAGLVSGVQRDETAWPPEGTQEQRLFLRRTFDQDAPVPLPQPGTGETGVLDPEPNTKAVDNVFTWFDTGAATEELSTRDPLNEPGHGYYSLYFKSAPLTQATRIAGSVVLDATVRASSGSSLTPVLLDVAPNGTARTIERGFLNLDFRNGLGKAEPAGSAWVKARARFLPQDVTLPAGHRIGLLVQSSNTVWALPGTPGQANILTGPLAQVAPEGSSLRIPVAPVG